MFIGHLAIAFILKKFHKKLSLGLTFFAVFFVEMVWAILVLAGIERVNIVAGFTAYNDLQLVFMPYSHGLVATIFWGALAYVIFRFIWGRLGTTKALAGAVMATAVVSHFVLDFVSHTADLPLIGGDGIKIGLGLWNSVGGTLIVEQALFIGALAVYYRSTSGKGILGKYGIAIFGIGLILLNLMTAFGPSESSGSQVAISILIIVPIFSAIAFGLDRKRSLSVSN